MIIISGLGQGINWEWVMGQITRSKEVPNGFDLRGIDFSGVNLNGQDFGDACLDYAIFDRAIGKGAMFDYCSLCRASR
ncbi:MAG: hypothetical protein KDA84_23555, partial [Planctomycetaceae bacterium]|nr:hypothetical protein [Planctomycetaceae bacterium]